MSDHPKHLTWFKSRFAWRQVYDELSDSELRMLIKSIWAFAEFGTEPEELPKSLRMVWVMIRAELLQDKLDRENGKKGGNPALLNNRGSSGVEGGLKGGTARQDE